MSTNNSNKKFRREAALERLNVQLESKEKTEKKGFTKIPLVDKDYKRIKNEIQILKTRIN